MRLYAYVCHESATYIVGGPYMGYYQREVVLVSKGWEGLFLTLSPWQHLTEATTMNPVPYCARFCGKKIHLDQNEKLVLSMLWELMAIVVR